jgi:Secretion system C-terminal sorting domain
MKQGIVVFLSILVAFAAFATQEDTALLGQKQTDRSITTVTPDAIDRTIDEFGDLHDPELMIQFLEGEQNHSFGIAWDGEFYWTINGGNSTGLLNRYDVDGNFMSVTNVTIDGRGIVFNPVDELLYISSYQGNIFRIDDPYTNEAITMVGSGIMQNGQASLGMSWDGNLLYDFSQGTVEVHDFWTFDLLDTFSGLNYGAGNFGGECAIVADTDYLYTMDSNSNTLYVYTLNGVSVGSYILPEGDNGMSPSMANYMIFYCNDSNYGIGTWFGYSLRDWTDGPVQFNLHPQVTIVPAGGGNVVYDAELVSELNMTVNGLQYRTFVTLPNGQVFGPMTTIAFSHTPFMNVYYVGLTQDIPVSAPGGDYLFSGGIYYNGNLQLSDDFGFFKEGVSTDNFVFNPEEWSGSSQFEIAGTTSGVVPNEFVLGEAYPNPFNPEMQISVTLPVSSDLSVVVYNMAGQQVATLADGNYSTGKHTLTFNGANMASGLYFVHATVPGQLNDIRKVTLLK